MQSIRSRRYCEVHFEKQSEGWSMLLEKGVYSVNDVRRFLNLNPVPGGDAHHVQLNLRALTETVEAVVKDIKLLKKAS